ncbi:MAG: transcriptional regulator [Gemmatimonadetes bacterium]|nr:transcriptional regulator [Gemmatimonadota bacterium]MYG85306.1 transcriptional regulator [Gemmatimonadota bacterium]MYJ88973.1 transcriptional regulator [Gemmatimonadota bacterium]
MADIKPIRSEADHEKALARIDKLMGSEYGSPEGDELGVLAALVKSWEDEHCPMGYPEPHEAIRFRMEQAGLRPRDLIPIFGSRGRVSDVLSGKRAITMPMARALHGHLWITTDVLLRNPGMES